MRRRDFITVIAGLGAVWLLTLTARAQQPQRLLTSLDFIEDFTPHVAGCCMISLTKGFPRDTLGESLMESGVGHERPQANMDDCTRRDEPRLRLRLL